MRHKKSSKGNRLSYSSQEFLMTFLDCVGFIASAGWITVVWGGMMWSWHIVAHVPIHHIWGNRQNPVIMIVFLQTENWTRYFVNCEAGPRWLELQEALFKQQQSVARPRLLNSARLLRHSFDHLLDLDVACLIQVLPWIAGLSCCRGESTPALPQWRRKVTFVRPGQS